MPRPTSNDALVQRHKQLRDTLIEKNARAAAEKILELKKPSVEQVAEIIAKQFNSSAI